MYAKVFKGLFYGSLTAQPHPQLVLVCLITHCDRDGIAEVPEAVISAITGISSEGVRDAIHVLESPDEKSRTPDHDGRRIEPLAPGRWKVLNYLKYRVIRSDDDRRAQNRVAQAKWRRKRTGLRKPKDKEMEKGEGEGKAEALERGLSSSLKLSPTPDGGGAYNQNVSPKENMAKLVTLLAHDKRLKAPAADWRTGAWDDAKAIAKTTEQAHELMEVAGWLRKRNVTDHVAISRVFRAIVQHAIKNPMAYFTRNGVALNAIIGQRAVERAEHEAAEIRRQEQAFLASGEALA